MNYAGDTNIFIGYTFCPDSFYKVTNDFIPNKITDIYWTNFVKSEYENKYLILSADLELLFECMTLIFESNENQFVSDYHSFKARILNETDFIDIDESKKNSKY